ncbi:MAG: NYN domain-containing protein [Chloroflexota bacterium]
MEETNRRLALMIDGDNAQAALLPEMLAEVSKYGIMTIRRVYGDWTESEMKSWKTVLHTYALQPVQQFRYTVGKNATDSALIIDAMDILYTAGIDGFCIASSDSDYTRLATRIREKNLFVMGIGRQNTARAFVNACDVFVYTENLQSTPEGEVKAEIPVLKTTTTKKKANKPVVKDTPELVRLKKLLRTALDSAVQDDSWANLGQVGMFLLQLDPGFDSRTYGYKKLQQLVETLPDFIEMRKVTNTKDNSAIIHIRLKPAA